MTGPGIKLYHKHQSGWGAFLAICIKKNPKNANFSPTSFQRYYEQEFNREFIIIKLSRVLVLLQCLTDKDSYHDACNEYCVTEF